MLSQLRESKGGYDNLADEYGNYFSAGGETRLNFLIKGPDGWGAKTIGFIEGDFRGATGGSNYGTFALRHAFMKMQWAKRCPHHRPHMAEVGPHAFLRERASRVEHAGRLPERLQTAPDHVGPHLHQEL